MIIDKYLSIFDDSLYFTLANYSMDKEVKTSLRTKQILSIMQVLTWIAFIGLLINAGAILTSYIVSCIYPEASKNLYMGLNLHILSQANFWDYTKSVSFMVVLLCMKAYVSFLVIKALSQVNLQNPFNLEVVQIIEKISYVLVGICLMGILSNVHSDRLLKSTGINQEEFAVEEFIFIAGLVFIISQIFKRGVEIQAENDLTV